MTVTSATARLAAGLARAAATSNATRWLVGRWLRLRALAVLPLALIVAAGSAGTMLALGAAQRTSNAYSDHLARADVGDVSINPVVNTREIDRIIRSLPDVDRITSSVLLTASTDDGRPRSRRDLLAGSGGISGNIIGSVDGRFTEMDRPVVQDGRMPAGPREMALTAAAADVEGLTIGDVVTLALWADEVNAGELIDGYLDDVVSPVGVEQVEVVGIVTLPDEVLPDDLYRRSRGIVSPDLVARYDCLPAAPRPGSTVEEAHAALLPDGCAVRYRMYSLSFGDGPAAVKPALDEVIRASRSMNEDLADLRDLPAGLDPPRYNIVATETDQERRRVERSIRPTTAALNVLAAAIAAMTIALGGLAAAREVRRTHADQRQWHQLGLGPAARAFVIASPPVAGIGAGLTVGIAAGWLLNPGPIGLVAVVEPAPARRLETLAVLAAVAVAAMVALVAAGLARRATGRADLAGAKRHGGGRGWSGFGLGIGSPAIADGLRTAFRSRTAGPVIAGAALLVAVLVAALSFGASLSAMVSTPRSYGWPWDASVVSGYGYFGLDREQAELLLDADPSVRGWSVLGLTNEVTLDGEPTMTLIDYGPPSVLDLPVLDGELPTADDEVAIGATISSARGIAVGDTVSLGGVFDPPRSATVTGLVVFPTLGPFEADRVGTGSGLLLSERAMQHSGYGAGAGLLASFVGVDLHDSADSPAARAQMRDRLRALDHSGFPAVDHVTPVRPPEIIDARSTGTVPTVVAVVFTSVTALGLGFASWASVRSRRRELAVLRALGFSSVQLRRSVRVQSIATMVAALAIGVLPGLIAGRVLWRGFATQLGVVPDPASPWGPVLLAVAVSLAVAVTAALLPAHMVSRWRPVEGLRTE